jgi:multisubunit Na+/H+ antiporter MnhG subunit
MALVVLLLWMTSSISSHVIMRMEYSIDGKAVEEETGGR